MGNPDGLYLIKGGGARVWKRFQKIRKEWRTSQGVIHGKRCGVTQNLGPAARLRALIKQADNNQPQLLTERTGEPGLAMQSNTSQPRNPFKSIT